MKTLKSIVSCLAIIAFSLANAQTELTVYTAVEAEDHPGIKINWVTV